MLKSASDTMILNMIMKNKKFSDYITNQRKEIQKIVLQLYYIINLIYQLNQKVKIQHSLLI